MNVNENLVCSFQVVRPEKRLNVGQSRPVTPLNPKVGIFLSLITCKFVN